MPHPDTEKLAKMKVEIERLQGIATADYERIGASSERRKHFDAHAAQERRLVCMLLLRFLASLDNEGSGEGE